MRAFLFVLIGLSFVSAATLWADKEDPKKDKSKQEKLTKSQELMKSKLKHAQTLLEGLALADFGKITQNAEELLAISKKAEWFISKTAKYELYSNDFRRSCETIVEKSKAKNLDGATLAYMELTLTCVKCHQYTREERISQAPLLDKDLRLVTP